MNATPPVRARSWSEVPAAAARAVTGALTDIDDTLTTEGRLTPDALGALQALRAAGLPVIAITGRSMGWSLPFARAWPVDAIVAESGAVALFMQEGELRTEYSQDEATRARHAKRLQKVAVRVLREVPGAVLAQDSAGRLTDIAVDHSEFTHLGEPQIDAVLRVMREEGMNATVSSTSTAGSANTPSCRARAGSSNGCWATASTTNSRSGPMWAIRRTTS